MTPVQCKMARAALGLSVVELAALAGLNKNTVTRFERFESGADSYTSTVARLRAALEATGKIRFEGDNGVFYLGQRI